MIPRRPTVCEAAAREAGGILLDWSQRFSVIQKGPADYVTEADLAAQETIQRRIREAFPDHGFLGEEGTHQQSDSPYLWIVDPLDGTTNYVHGIPYYCTSIGLAHEGQLIVGAVFDPNADACYTAVRGQGAFLNGSERLETRATTDVGAAVVAASLSARVAPDSAEAAAFNAIASQCHAIRRFGSAALNLCLVAAGKLDAYWALCNSSWDVAAGMLLVSEAGGAVASPDGSPVDLSAPRLIAAATDKLHAGLREVVGNGH